MGGGFVQGTACGLPRLGVCGREGGGLGHGQQVSAGRASAFKFPRVKLLPVFTKHVQAVPRNHTAVVAQNTENFFVLFHQQQQVRGPLLTDRLKTIFAAKSGSTGLL